MVAINIKDVTPTTPEHAEIIHAAYQQALSGVTPSGTALRQGGEKFVRAYKYFARGGVGAGTYAQQVQPGGAYYKPPEIPTPVTAPTPPPGVGTYVHVITGEKVSALEPPGKAWSKLQPLYAGVPSVPTAPKPPMTIAEQIKEEEPVTISEQIREPTTITEQIREKEFIPLTYKDVSLRQTFFPETQMQYYQRTGRIEKPPTFQSFAESKFKEFDIFLGERVGKKLPAFLTEPKYQFSATALGKFVLFAPLMATTGEQVAKIPKEVKVKVIGKQQEISKDIIKSDVIFKTSEREIGKATAITKVKGFEKVQFGETKAIIQKGTPAYDIVTGKIRLVGKGRLIGVQKSIDIPKKVTLELGDDILRVSKELGEGFEQLSLGGVAGKGRAVIPTGKFKFDMSRYISISKGGKVAKDLTAVGSKAFTSSGGIVKTEALIKTIPPVSRDATTMFIKTPRPVTKLATQQVSGIISGIVKPVSKTIPITSITGISAKVITLKPKVKTIVSDTTLKQVSVPKESLMFRESLRFKGYQIEMQKPVLKEKLATSIITKQIPKTTSKQLLATSPILATSLKQAQQQKTRLSLGIGIITPTITTFPILPPFLPKFERRKKPRKKRKVKFPTRKTKYIPTIAAMTYKFTGPKIPTAYKIGVAGAFGGRPVIKKKKTKIKRKKK